MLSRTFKILSAPPTVNLEIDAHELMNEIRSEPVVIRGPRIEKTLESMTKARDGTQQILNDLLAEKARIEHEIESTTVQLRAWGAACEKMQSSQLDIPDILDHQ